EGLFQSIYPSPQSEVAAYVSSIEWVALTIFMAALGMPLEKLRIVPLLMFGATFLVALSHMMAARIERRFDTVPARVLVTFLALTQPLVRGWSGYFAWHQYKYTPRAVISQRERGLAAESRRGGTATIDFCAENGQGRERSLTELFALLGAEGWRYSS